MNDANRPDGQPRTIVLATDLGARCDRAMDRAAGLADDWGARLVAVHAIEESSDFYGDELERRLPSWRRKDPAAVIAALLHRDLMGREVRAVVEGGEPAALVLRTVQDSKADLVVTGLARDEPLGRFSVGATVDRLARRSAVPVLIVKERPRQPYARILVASDFSDSSLEALRVAMRFFPHAHLTVFKAFDTPMSGVVADQHAYAEGLRANALAEGEAFVARVGFLPDERRLRVTLVAEPGDPAELIRRYAEDQGIDLVVAGAHGRGRLFDLLIGSTGRSILSAVPCDALLVPGEHAAGAQ
ncbi:MAG: universal stress protein [Bauldia sp.]